MKKIWFIGAVSLLALLAAGVAGVHRWFNPPPPPVQLFTNGTIMTMDPGNPQVDAMLVKRGEIVALGDSDALRDQVSRDVRVVDLQGGMLMPGFIEAHGHFPVRDCRRWQWMPTVRQLATWTVLPPCWSGCAPWPSDARTGR